jgi:fructosamine-3-kinase
MACELPRALTEALRAQTGATVTRAEALGGGSIAASYRVRLQDGRSVFVKTHPSGAAMFETEAAGLRWLAEAQALPIPEVIAVGTGSPAFLALAYFEPGPPARDHDERLGRGLARLHDHGAPCFGWERDNFVGALPQAGDPRPDWPAFYGECRLLPLVERASEAGLLGTTIRARLERVLDRLVDLCGPPEPPARLHGDLWAGNAITTQDGSPALVDPAVYGGHREIDLAMMHLFGGFSDRCFAAYHELHPLAPGVEQRVPLYQLYPLLVHVNLFGRGYLSGLDRALRRLT